jgi:hypothetical protein
MELEMLNDVRQMVVRIESAQLTLFVIIMVQLILVLMGQVLSVTDVITRWRTGKPKTQNFGKQLNRGNTKGRRPGQNDVPDYDPIKSPGGEIITARDGFPMKTLNQY